jgi:transcriptional regulator with XRE-family HTH domain
MTATPPAAAAPGRRPRIRYLDKDKLLKARVEARLSQGQLATKVGGRATQSLISMWERGRQGTSLQQLEVLATALGKKPEDLMPDELLARISTPTAQRGHKTAAGNGKKAGQTA